MHECAALVKMAKEGIVKAFWFRTVYKLGVLIWYYGWDSSVFQRMRAVALGG